MGGVKVWDSGLTSEYIRSRQGKTLPVEISAGAMCPHPWHNAMTRWRQRLVMMVLVSPDLRLTTRDGHPVLCWPRLTAGQLATNHYTRNVQTSETARPLITIRDTDHTFTHLELQTISIGFHNHREGFCQGLAEKAY